MVAVASPAAKATLIFLFIISSRSSWTPPLRKGTLIRMRLDQDGAASPGDVLLTSKDAMTRRAATPRPSTERSWRRHGSVCQPGWKLCSLASDAVHTLPSATVTDIGLELVSAFVVTVL